jgi:drug/metabolite transporter (DMT)-like permease
MDFLYPLVAIVSESAAQTIDKINFRKHKLAATYLMWIVFVGMFGSLFVYLLLTHKSLPHFNLTVAGLLLLIALVSFAANIFDYKSLKADDISLREPLLCFEPILAGLFGYILFPAERKPALLIALVVSLFLVNYGTRRRRLGKIQSRGIGYLFLGIVLYSLLPSIYKFTLPHLSPEYIAFFRVWAILVLTTVFMPIKIHFKNPSTVYLGLLAGLINAVAAVASLYAIKKLGVVQTSLLLILSPTIIYLSGYFILKEKVRTGEVISSIGLAIVVIGSTIFW